MVVVSKHISWCNSSPHSSQWPPNVYRGRCLIQAGDTARCKTRSFALKYSSATYCNEQTEPLLGCCTFHFGSSLTFYSHARIKRGWWLSWGRHILPAYIHTTFSAVPFQVTIDKMRVRGDRLWLLWVPSEMLKWSKIFGCTQLNLKATLGSLDALCSVDMNKRLFCMFQ